MPLPGSEQDVLKRIEARLHAEDPGLTSDFAVFSSITSQDGGPAIERLATSRPATAIARFWGRRPALWAVLALLLLFLVGALLAAATVLALSGTGQNSCVAAPARSSPAVSGYCSGPARLHGVPRR
jgi:Protein of unknown function (DUF3040)